MICHLSSFAKRVKIVNAIMLLVWQIYAKVRRHLSDFHTKFAKMTSFSHKLCLYSNSYVILKSYTQEMYLIYN